MPRELVVVQVGQCGMQLGTKFWDLALREHSQHAAKLKAGSSKEGAPLYDDALSSFFRNVDTRDEGIVNLPVGNGKGPVRTLKARSVLVDMEEGVINNVMRGPLAELFDTVQTVKDVSGSGNNWAHGHEVYGPKYADEILEAVRAATEPCDSLQSFFFMHSLGGGTGSGLGTYILRMLKDAYPDVYRFSTCVFPSVDDDVVTSPYNSMLSLAELIKHADCVLPFENQALLDMCDAVNSRSMGNGKSQRELHSPGRGPSLLTGQSAKKSAFDDMNTIGAHVIANLTCSMRFEGSLNVDLNEITMNLVPFPGLHFLIPALAPLCSLRQNSVEKGRGIDSMFTESFSPVNQLLKVNPQKHRYLCAAWLVRGGVQISDINRNIARMKPQINLINWNEDGFKIGLCSVPPVGQPYSVLCLQNNCVIADTFAAIKQRFSRLYRRRAHVHHYTEYMDIEKFDEALVQVKNVISNYAELATFTPGSKRRWKPAV